MNLRERPGAFTPQSSNIYWVVSNTVCTVYCCDTFITHFFLTQMDSRLHSDNLEKVLDVAVKGCSRVHTILDHAVKDNLERSSSSFAFWCWVSVSQVLYIKVREGMSGHGPSFCPLAVFANMVYSVRKFEGTVFMWTCHKSAKWASNCKGHAMACPELQDHPEIPSLTLMPTLPIEYKQCTHSSFCFQQV